MGDLGDWAFDMALKAEAAYASGDYCEICNHQCEDGLECPFQEEFDARERTRLSSNVKTGSGSVRR